MVTPQQHYWLVHGIKYTASYKRGIRRHRMLEHHPNQPTTAPHPQQHQPHHHTTTNIAPYSHHTSTNAQEIVMCRLLLTHCDDNEQNWNESLQNSKQRWRIMNTSKDNSSSSLTLWVWETMTRVLWFQHHSFIQTLTYQQQLQHNNIWHHHTTTHYRRPNSMNLMSPAPRPTYCHHCHRSFHGLTLPNDSHLFWLFSMGT